MAEIWVKEFVKVDENTPNGKRTQGGGEDDITVN